MELKALEGAGPPSAVALVPMEKKSDRVKKANCVCLCTQASKRALRNKADASNGVACRKECLKVPWQGGHIGVEFRRPNLRSLYLVC